MKKSLNKHTATINLIFLLQLGIISLICLIDLILLQTSKTSLNLLSRNTKFLAENTSKQIYPNKIKSRIVFKVKTGYKLELLSSETMKLLGSTKRR